MGQSVPYTADQLEPQFQKALYRGGAISLLTARERDKESGLYFYRARYYDPNIGRFLQPDPIGFEGGDINLYVYVANNPILWVDPLGLAYWGNVWSNFVAVNNSIPGIAAPTGVGVITAGQTAQAVGSTTALTWATSGFSGATFGASSFTAFETGVIVGGTALLNFSLTTAAWEGGAFVGSMVSAIPVYGTNQTVGQWWGQFLWNLFNDPCP